MLTKALATAACGAALGAIMLPGAALANTSVSPGVTQPGGMVTITVACNQNTQASAEVIGPSKMQTFDVKLHAQGGTNKATFTVPGGTASMGKWTVNGLCAGGAAGSTSFTVSPGGGPPSGDGGSSQNGMLLGTGVTLLAAAAGGFVLLRRRVTV